MVMESPIATGHGGKDRADSERTPSFRPGVRVQLCREWGSPQRTLPGGYSRAPESAYTETDSSWRHRFREGKKPKGGGPRGCVSQLRVLGTECCKNSKKDAGWEEVNRIFQYKTTVT